MSKQPLFVSGFTHDGRPLLAGLFRLKDEVGFPLDMSYEECKERGYAPDWAEALADAGRQGSAKYDSVLRELGYLLGEPAKRDIVHKFQLWVTRLGLPFKEACEAILKQKRG